MRKTAIKFFFRAIICLTVPVLLAGCSRREIHQASPLTQRGYLWQRDWTPSVVSAIQEAQRHMDGAVLLGAEIHWDGKIPEVIYPNINWEILRNVRKPISIALRVNPFSGPFSNHDIAAKTLVQTAISLLQRASEHQVAINEFQLDFDCAKSKLAGYRLWVEELRKAIHPLPLVITALPSWLDDAEFTPLVCAADGYVLQVHSVPTKEESGRSSLCDPMLAKKWVSKASRLGLPFSVSLPTYHAIAGYAPSGKLLGVIMDCIQQAWPPDTRILDFTANPDEIANLVHEWQSNPPSGMKELLWYRIPVSTDQENWRWPTLLAVMQGRKPRHQLSVALQGDNPIDIQLSNTGEAEETTDSSMIATWETGTLVASDALGGWNLDTGKNQATFIPVTEAMRKLCPGEMVDAGWLRFDRITQLQVHVSKPIK